MTRDPAVIDHGIERNTDPSIYACWCGHHSDDRIALEQHVDEERAKIHRPYLMTTSRSFFPGHGSSSCGLELHSTPYADTFDAIEVLMIVPARSGHLGHLERHTILMTRRSLDSFAEGLRELPPYAREVLFIGSSCPRQLYPCGIEIQHPKQAADADAVELVMTVPDWEDRDGYFERHTIWVHKTQIDFLVEAIARHKLTEGDL